MTQEVPPPGNCDVEVGSETLSGRQEAQVARVQAIAENNHTLSPRADWHA